MSRVLVWLAVAALLVAIGRCSVQPPVGPSRDSTRLAHAADTVRMVDSSLQTVNRGLQNALGRANRELEVFRTRKPPAIPQRLPDASPREDSLRTRIAADSVDLTHMAGTLEVVRDSLAGAVDSLTAIRERLALVPDLVDHGAEVVGRLERRAVRNWTAGALFEPGSPVPVGGYVEVRVLGRVSLTAQATDGPNEKATARFGVGLNW